MKTIVLLSLTVLFSSMSQASAKCKDNQKLISCEGVQKSKRESFCYKGEPSKKRKMKICTSAKRFKKSKKTVMKGQKAMKEKAKI